MRADLCATSATTSAPCAKLTDSRSEDVNAGTYTNDEGYGCPEFPAGASCSQFTGIDLETENVLCADTSLSVQPTASITFLIT